MQQICAGMEALAAEKMVHRDLAARNVLVFHFDASNPFQTRVKVSDFGLAVDLYGRTYKTVPGGELPFRWLPPEALEKRRFSEKSDVWAMGVTMWELLSDGNVPYSAINDDEVLHRRVCAGERLARPGGCPDELWRIVNLCWAADPRHRPDFTSLLRELSALETRPASREVSLSMRHQEGTDNM